MELKMEDVEGTDSEDLRRTRYKDGNNYVES
jgi:hypothetical protein